MRVAIEHHRLESNLSAYSSTVPSSRPEKRVTSFPKKTSNLWTAGPCGQLPGEDDFLQTLINRLARIIRRMNVMLGQSKDLSVGIFTVAFISYSWDILTIFCETEF